jgi:formylglycine-generating enzyme required for sulfatase activity
VILGAAGLAACAGNVQMDGVPPSTTDAGVEAGRDAGASTPPSCERGAPGADRTCGPEGRDDCCATGRVPGGSFDREYDGVQFSEHLAPATVSPFDLDVYEITVGRFRAFVDAYPASKPRPGDGAHPLIPDSGWQAGWPIAENAEALRKVLAAPGENCVQPTWTDVPADKEHLPINCLTWYELFAFCAWDEGRLPTAAETIFAAAGGDEQRVFPWSVPPKSTVLDETYAVYHNTENPKPPPPPPGSGPAPVGTHPKGMGRWGHLDLSGNIDEFVLDYSGITPVPCTDCANLTSLDGTRAAHGGGWWQWENALWVAGAPGGTTKRDHNYGARCARDIPR